jgi:translation elongation factor EF-Tu-like GTPase
MARFFIQDVYNITGIGPIPVGKVEDGVLRVGMKTTIQGKTFEVKTLEMHHEQVQEAKVGDSVGMSIKLVAKGLPENAPTQPKPSFLKRLFSAPDNGYADLKTMVGKSVEFV